MIEFPLIRFDNKMWLERLQEGEFFMRTSLFYQLLESEDLARGDQYDGAIPFEEKIHVFESLSGSHVSNLRLIEPNIFIKCFYHCSYDDFIPINKYIWKLSLSESTKKEMQRFNADSVLILFSPLKFVKQIEDAFCNYDEPVYYSDVIYLSDEQYVEITNSILTDPENRTLLSFYKHKRFSEQKEFRVCVRHLYEGIKERGQLLDIPKSVVKQSYTCCIGRLENSCIVSVDNLFNHGILYDTRIDHFYICEE